MTPIEAFNEQGRARHQCPACGHITAPILATSADKVQCRCAPGIVRQAINFIPAAATHFATGAKAVSDEARAARLTTCQVCELFNGTVCTHPKCGCAIKTDRAFIDKLGWASSVCPLNKWPQ